MKIQQDSDLQPMKVTADKTINVRDKGAMRERLIEPKMELPGRVQIQQWLLDDASGRITYEFATSF